MLIESKKNGYWYNKKRELSLQYNFIVSPSDDIDEVFLTDINTYNTTDKSGESLDNDTNMKEWINWSSTYTGGRFTSSIPQMVSSNLYKADSTHGAIIKLINCGDRFYGVQESGVFQINYNTRSLINTDSDAITIGSPQLIQNIYYILNDRGATNIKCVLTRNNDLYLLDINNKELYLLNTKGIINIGTSYYMQQWFDTNITKDSYLSYVDINRTLTIFSGSSQDWLFFNNHFNIMDSIRTYSAGLWIYFNNNQLFCHRLDTSSTLFIQKFEGASLTCLEDPYIEFSASNQSTTDKI